MIQFPLDKDLAPPEITVHIVFRNDLFGVQKVLGIFRSFNQAQEFVEEAFPKAPKRRVFGFEVYDMSDGDVVEIVTWAVA